MSIVRLYVSRVMRADVYVPKKCYAHHYIHHLYKGDTCDCVAFCKYPPKGDVMYISLKEENDYTQTEFK